jgi:hypothetical protein
MKGKHNLERGFWPVTDVCQQNLMKLNPPKFKSRVVNFSKTLLLQVLVGWANIQYSIDNSQYALHVTMKDHIHEQTWSQKHIRVICCNFMTSFQTISSINYDFIYRKSVWNRARSFAPVSPINRAGWLCRDANLPAKCSKKLSRGNCFRTLNFVDSLINVYFLARFPG